MQGSVTTSAAQAMGSVEVRRRPASTDSLGALQARGFSPVLRSIAANTSPGGRAGVYDIQPGDTLSGIAQRRLQELGRPHDAANVARAVERLAVANGISDPDRIFAGDRIQLHVLSAAEGTSARATETRQLNASDALVARRWGMDVGRDSRSPSAMVSGSQPPALVGPAAGRGQGASPDRLVSTWNRQTASNPGEGRGPTFPQLTRTLDRAVERGYINASDRQAVHDRVVELSRKFRFSPDDFATVALMESDGLNPQASNGRCHGILQFCEGPAQGAATVGMQGRASEIRNQSVLEQLDLVDRYFEGNRLGERGAVSLVDLYLTVLTPAARSEQRPHAALEIAGPQAKVLHIDGDRARPITRNSIFSGLISHAQQRLEALIQPRRGGGDAQMATSNSPATNAAAMATTHRTTPTAGAGQSERGLRDWGERNGRQG